MRKHTWLWGLAAAAAGLLSTGFLSSSRGNVGLPSFTHVPAPEAAAVAALRVRVNASTIWVIANFHTSSGTTGILDSLTSSAVAVQGHSLAASATVDSFAAGPATANASGQFIIRGTYTGGVTPAVSLPWSYTAPVVVTVPAAPTGITLTAHLGTSQLWLVTSWTPSAGATSYADTVALNVSPWTVLGGHAISVTSPDSFAVPIPTVSTPYFICVRAINSAGTSSCNFNSVTYTPVAPPGSPTIDSLRVKSVSYTTTAPTGQVVTYLASGNFTVGTNTAARLYCAYLFMSDGSVHRDSIPPTVTDATKRATSCDSLGRALYNVRFSMRPLPASLRRTVKLASTR